jgi:putative DNA methylase
MTSNPKRLVEEQLPLSEANLNASLEMAFRGMAAKFKDEFSEIYGIQPKKIGVGTTLLRNLHPWPARRPTAPARLLTLASVLPNNFDREHFREISGLLQIPELAKQDILPTLLHTEPLRTKIENVLKEYGRSAQEILIVDPMAGGGSIPLESLRLGFRTVAMEYNPVAYLILKATLDYPAKYGPVLYKDVRDEARKLIEWAKSELSQYYSEDSLNYIIARGYRCPVCGGLVPIIHSNRLGKNGPYVNLVVDRAKKTFGIVISETGEGFEKLRCIYCETKTPMDKESIFKYWVEKHKDLLQVALAGNANEARDKLGMLKEVHMLLLKQTKKGFKSCDEKDFDAFEKAYLDLAEQARELKKYLPDIPIPIENEVFAPVREAGIEYWYQLFNPRQLLILLKLLKYVSQRCKTLIEEKGEYGTAIATYLAFGMDKLMNFDNITTEWDESTKTIRELLDHYARTRKVDLGLEYCEMPPIVTDPKKSLNWVFEPDVEKPTATHGGICPVLKNLCNWLNGLGDRIHVFMADARNLDKILGERVVDVVNVDPPYLGQHLYSDFSEFFWQLLRVSMKPAFDARLLFNRDEEKGEVELFVDGWNPILSTVPREGEIISRKDRGAANTPHTAEWYVKQMWKFFSSAEKVLRDDGVLVVWFTHSKPEAWESILSALYGSGFVVSKVWAVRTEMVERRVAQEGFSFFSSLAIIARKGRERIVTGKRGVKDLVDDRLVRDVIRESLADAYRSARDSRANGYELLIMTLAGAIAGATRVRNPDFETPGTVQATLEGNPQEDFEAKRFELMSAFFKNQLYPAALYLGAEWLLYQAMKEAGFNEDMIRECVSSDPSTIAHLLLWEAAKYVGEPVVDYDFAEKICKVSGANLASMEKLGLIRKSAGIEVLFGKQMLEAVKGEIEKLDKTFSGKAALIIELILDSPIRGDPVKAAEFVVSKMPVGKRETLIALFLLRTVREEWFEKIGLNKLVKPFVEQTLLKLTER